MKQDAGLFLIIGSLFALWLYNTGRASAMIAVIKNPSTAPSLFAGGPTGTGTPGHPGSGGYTGPTNEQIAMCYEENANGVANPQCIQQIWKGLNSPDDWGAFLQNELSSIFGGLFG